MATFILCLLAISQAWAAPAPQQSSAGSSYSSGDAYPTSSVLGPETSNAATSLAASSAPTHTLVPNQQAPANEGLFLDFSETEYPQAIRGENGGFDFGDLSRDYDRLNSDLFARPGTDAGSVPNSKWPMGLSSARSGSGGGNPGWARQQNTNEMPIAQSMASVDMRLAPNAHRELHWHSANEWAYVFNGSARIAVVNEEGQTYVDDIEAGDLWFFPAGVPHSIQASPAGVEFLLVFSQGDFSEDATDLVSELFLRNPKEVLAKNFQTDISDFDDIPKGERYIFNGTPFPQNLTEVQQSVLGPAGMVPESQSYTYHLSRQEAMQVPGGSVKVVDPTVFPLAQNFSAALITIEPGAMREIHWHLSSDEWNFFLSGRARLTSFSAPDASRTFDFQAGDVGYIPVENSHYVENVGDETVTCLEVLQAPRYTDMSVGQWLGLTPPQIVSDTLHLPQSLIDRLPKVKRWVVPGNANYSTTNFTDVSMMEKREPRGWTRNAKLRG